MISYCTVLYDTTADYHVYELIIMYMLYIGKINIYNILAIILSWPGALLIYPAIILRISSLTIGS